MDIVSAFGSALLAAVAVFVVDYLSRGRFREIRAEISALQTGVDRLRVDVGADISSIRGEMAIMRSDLTQVALAVGARRKPNTG